MKSSILKASMLLAFTACNDEANFQGATPVTTPPINVSPTEPICNQGEKLNDMRIAFLVDVSGSNAMFDCKEPYRTSFGTTACASTEREASMNTIFNSLNQYSKDLTGTKPSINFALATYPSERNQKSGAEIQLGWTEVNDANQSVFAKSTEVTRNPMGWTPLDAGLAVTKELFSTTAQNTQEDRIITVITDGEQTPHEKEATERHLAELKSTYNVRSIIVLKLPNDNSNYAHEGAIRSFVEKNNQPFWLNGPSFYDEAAFNEYFTFNKNITRNMATTADDYFELKDKDQLTNKLFERIKAHATCL